MDAQIFSKAFEKNQFRKGSIFNIQLLQSCLTTKKYTSLVLKILKYSF